MAKKTLIGTVLKKSSDKTISVSTVRRIQHKVYLKSFIKTKKYLVHDEDNFAQEGDVVLIQESIPISKRKSWIFVSKLDPKTTNIEN